MELQKNEMYMGKKDERRESRMRWRVEVIIAKDRQGVRSQPCANQQEQKRALQPYSSWTYNISTFPLRRCITTSIHCHGRSTREVEQEKSNRRRWCVQL